MDETNGCCYLDLSEKPLIHKLLNSRVERPCHSCIENLLKPLTVGKLGNTVHTKATVFINCVQISRLKTYLTLVVRYWQKWKLDISFKDHILKYDTLIAVIARKL